MIAHPNHPLTFGDWICSLCCFFAETKPFKIHSPAKDVRLFWVDVEILRFENCWDVIFWGGWNHLNFLRALTNKKKHTAEHCGKMARSGMCFYLRYAMFHTGLRVVVSDACFLQLLLVKSKKAFFKKKSTSIFDVMLKGSFKGKSSYFKINPGEWNVKMSSQIPSLKLTVRPWKSMIGRYWKTT